MVIFFRQIKNINKENKDSSSKGEPFGHERNFKNFIRQIPNTLQGKKTKNSEKSERETGIPESDNRRSDDPSCYYMGCSCSLLHDQHWQTSGVFDFARSADDMADQTPKPVGEMGFNFRSNTRGNRDNQEQTNREPIPTDNNSCGVEIRRTEDENIVRGVANRRQEYQKTIINVSAESRLTVPSSLSPGCEWEFGKESRVMVIRKLCGNNHIVPSSIMETGNINQNLYDKDSISRNDATLRELRPNHELDVASLLELLMNKYSYHEATNNDILTDHEIRLLDGIYRITDFQIVLACYNYCYWLEVNGAIYFWSRLDDSLVRGGDNMKEALTNYLFNRENLRYVVEYSLELIPLDAYEEEAEEWANSPEACVNNDIDVTKLSLKHEPKMGGKKKQQKKKKKKKNKNKH